MKKILCFLLILMTAVTAACAAPQSPNEALTANPTGDLKAHFIDVDQGDFILLESDGDFVLIDSGESDYSEKALSYLNTAGVKSLKYVIATHPHSDHSGGLRAIINEIPAENFITSETDCDTFVWTKLLKAVDRLGVNYIDAKAGNTYSFGDSSFTIMGPLSDGYEGYNGYSVVVKAVCGDISFMLTGDAEKINEKEMLDAGEDVRADLLKCGHHGSSSSTCTRFLQAVDPAFAIVTCGKDNEYGHPHKETTEQLELLGCPYYSTAEYGTLIASTDGKNLDITSSDSKMKAQTYTAGTPKNPDSELTFIGNKNSGYFHEPICDGVKTMNPKNKIEFDTYEQAVNAGYKPCPSCDP